SSAHNLFPLRQIFTEMVSLDSEDENGSNKCPFEIEIVINPMESSTFAKTCSSDPIQMKFVVLIGDTILNICAKFGDLMIICSDEKPGYRKL
ncbi:hypothetical protein, partial [Enterococcus faecalis]|uniref:hypothetical protein n=1 Tax=Enterococcus faecalis TaxID=1351 RepID=UPI0019D29700